MVDINCPVSVDEQMHDFKQSAADKDADMTLEIARQNGDFALAVKRILTNRIDLTFIQENIDFCTGDPRSEPHDMLGIAVLTAVVSDKDKDWAVVNTIMKDVFTTMIHWEALQINAELEENPKLIDEALRDQAMTYTEQDGKRDCINGIPHKEGKGEAYDMGYLVQYQREQMQSAQTIDPPNVDQFFNSNKRTQQ